MPNAQPGTPGNELNTIGWYYDDFSDAANECPSATRRRVGFTNAGNAMPPSGVRVWLECDPGTDGVGGSGGSG